MLQTGEKVIYGAHGICCVTGMEAVAGNGKSRQYYALQPIQSDGSRYMIPADNAAVLNRLLPLTSAEEWERLLASSEVHSGSWISDENQRKQTYRELTSHGRRTELLSMLRVLYMHRKEQRDAGKKVHICDEAFLRDSEKGLAEEVAYVFGLGIEDAKHYLQSKLTVRNPA